jgi:three-Cys-motif partner protein
MVDNQFFVESREQSEKKARIVSNYFWAWATVIIGATSAQSRIAYIDLFAGPGRYGDGTLSTPLLVLKKAIADPKMHNILVTLFNDKDANNVGSLKKAIRELRGIDRLKYEPEVNNAVVDDEIKKDLARRKLVPTLLFLDPWGYKGLSAGLINSVLKNWGCDCVFFFNYNRVNMGLNNDAVREHMNVLFGESRADSLRRKLVRMKPYEREQAILESLAEALREMGANFVLPFRFRSDKDNRTTHHLIFTTKHFRGFEIMRGIIGKESSEENQGVPSFEHSRQAEQSQRLIELTPLDDLADMLLKDLAGERLTMRQIFERHSVDKLFIDRNYKRALVALEASEKIVTRPAAKDRRVRNGEVTFGDDVVVTFPKRKSR